MPRKTESNVYSITVRPTNGIQSRHPDCVDKFVQYCSSQTYVCSIEKAGSASSHIQACIKFNESKRQDNILRAMRSIFPPLSDAETRNMICVKSHDDWKYVVGYCTKEVQPSSTSLSNDDLKICQDYYKERIKPIRITHKVDPNDAVIAFMEQYAILHNADPKDLSVYDCLSEMVRQRIITPSQYIKVKQESLQMYWNSMHAVPLAHDHIVSEGRDLLGECPSDVL